MNTSRLKEILDLLRSKEKQYKIQGLLSNVNDQLANLASSPQQREHQTAYATSFEKLKAATTEMAASFQPSQIKQLEEIGAEPFFTHNLADQIASWIQDNPISPAVAQAKVADLLQKRASFVEDVNQLREKLTKLNVAAPTITAGEAEIGFLLPRDLFHNKFDELIKELGVINYILRTFSVVATGSAQPVEVKQISTTDPQFFLGLDPITIGMLGGVITWALAQWKTVEEIRKLRSETKKNSNFSSEEIKNFFDGKIEATIKKAIDEKTSELLPNPTSPHHSGELTWALQSLFARIERGMTVEVRFLPPPTKPAEGDKAAEPVPPEFARLNEISKQLIFPAIDKAPVLEIPPPQPQAPTPKK